MSIDARRRELTKCICDLRRHRGNDSNDCQGNSEDESGYGPEHALRIEHLPEAWACIISRRECFSIWSTSVGVDGDCVFDIVVDSWLDRLALAGGREPKGCLPTLAAVQGWGKSQYGQGVQHGRYGHAQDSQPDFMRGGTNDEERSDDKDGNGGGVVQVVETPSAVGAERSIETFFLHEFECAHAELDIGGTAPEGGDDGKGDPALNLSSISEAIVESDGHSASIHPHEEDEEYKLPSLPAAVPGEG